MKKRQLLAAVMALFGALLWLVTAPSLASTAAAKPIELTLSSAFVPGSSDHFRSTWFMSEVTKRTKGQVTFKSYWGAALAPPVGQLDLVRKGVVDIICTSLGYWPGIFPFAGFSFAFPFGSDDPAIVGTALRRTMEAFPQYDKKFADEGLVNLSNTTRSYYTIMSTIPARNIAELKGKKVGLIGRFFAMWVEAVGLVPIVQPGGDRYMSLQTKLMDMSILPIDMNYAFKIHEVTKFAIDVGLGTYLNEGLLMSAASFKKLSPEFQKIFLEVGKEAELTLWDYDKKQKGVLIEAMKKAGITFIEFPKAERDAWIAATPDTTLEAVKLLEDKGYPGTEMVRRYQEEMAKLGYSWTRKWGVRK